MEKGRFETDDCFLLLFDMKLDNFNTLLPILEKLNQAKKPFVIVCNEIDDEVLSALIINKMRGNFNCCVVKSPFFGEKRTAVLEDIACITNTFVINATNLNLLQNLTLDALGKAKQIKITNESTIISAKVLDNNKFETRKNLIQAQIDNCPIEFDKEQLKMRYANLTGGIAVVFVGAQSDVEQKDKKLRIEDAISATSSALSDGIIPGGGITLFRLIKPLKKYIRKLNEEHKKGAEIVLKSLSCPLNQILENANCNSQKIMDKLEKNKILGYGYDALNNKFCNMIKINSGFHI